MKYFERLTANLVRVLLSMSLIFLISCGDDDDDDDMDPGGDGPAIVRIVSLDTENEQVTLQNLGGSTASISGFYFCLGPGQYNILSDYSSITGDLNLDADETVTIDLTSGSQNVSALPDANGGLGLFATDNFTSSSNSDLRDYVQWGAAGQNRVDQAVTAGVWDDAANFVDGVSPYAFIGDAADFGAAFWQGTAGTAAVQFLAIDPIAETVAIKNFGTASRNIADYQLCLGPGQYNILSDYTTIDGDLDLSPDEVVIITVTSGSQNVTALPDVNGGLGLFANNNFSSTSADDIKDYVQWGAANQNRVDQAVAAGRWDDANAFVAGAAPYDFVGEAEEVGSSYWIDNTIIRMSAIDPIEDLVTIQNFDQVDRDLTNYFFCTLAGVYPQLGNDSEVEVITGSLTLAPGEEVTVRVLTTGGVVDDNGSLFLFSSGILGFNNQNAAVTRDFAQWDAGNGFRVENAVATGRWDDASNFIDGDDPFTYIGGAEDVGPTFWEAATANIRLLTVDPGTEAVEIQNFGTASRDISDYQLCLGPGQYNILSNYTSITGDLDLAPGETVTIDLSSGSQNVTALPDAEGGLGLFANNNFTSNSPDDMKDYVQWGAANQNRVGQAVAAGRWDDATSFVDGAAPFEYTGDGSDIGADSWQ